MFLEGLIFRKLDVFAILSIEKEGLIHLLIEIIFINLLIKANI
jgi:hypothetical protein